MVNRLVKKDQKLTLYSLEEFLSTVKGMAKYQKLTDIQLAGFSNLMRSKDMLFVYDPHVYLEELDHYING